MKRSLFGCHSICYWNSLFVVFHYQQMYVMKALGAEVVRSPQGSAFDSAGQHPPTHA